MNFISTKIDNYTLLNQIHPMMRTSVFEAIDESENKYAIKISSKESILNEYKMMNDIRHPLILKAINCIQVESNNVLIMPLASQDLASYIESFWPLSEEKNKEIMFSLLTAINHLHLLGIWHRDIKPPNILVFNDPNEQFILGDLEFAGFFDDQKPKYIQGTKDFFAPELIMKTSYNNKIDCWAAGCVMYVLQTGQLPFDNRFDQASGNLYFPDISPVAEDLIRHLICVKSEDRYSAQQALNHEYFRNMAPIISSDVETKVFDLMNVQETKYNDGEYY